MSSRPTSASMLSMLPQPIQPIPGDSFNDLEMLKRARFSVAMANAAEELKQIARFTTDSNDADGVLNQLEQWFA